MTRGLNFDMTDDGFLAARVLSGEFELYRVLVERHKKKVYSLGYGFLRNKDDAEDFTQDVFIKAFRALSSFKGNARFSTWLYKIAYNTAVNIKERRKEYMSLSQEDSGNTGGNTGGKAHEARYLTPEENAVRESAKLAVRQAVAELPEKYKICIDLFFFYERTYEEIESITGEPLGTIKSHIFRAKKILREKLKDLR